MAKAPHNKGKVKEGGTVVASKEGALVSLLGGTVVSLFGTPLATKEAPTPPPTPTRTRRKIRSACYRVPAHTAKRGEAHGPRPQAGRA